MNQLNIGLDFDETFTAAPELWHAFVRLAQSMGHEVRFVTYRPHAGWNDDIEREAQSLGLQIHYTAGGQKAPFCEAIGWNVDIWIDDSPHAIPSLANLVGMAHGCLINNEQ